jgi:hypothetical protein
MWFAIAGEGCMSKLLSVVDEWKEEREIAVLAKLAISKSWSKENTALVGGIAAAERNQGGLA